jgi:hypothetical protein
MEYKMAAKGNQIAENLPKHFDEIWRTVTKNTKDNVTYGVIANGGDSKFKARSRFGCFNQVEEPDMEKMLAKVEESFKKGQ